jgi:pilus assembly protein CpaE
MSQKKILIVDKDEIGRGYLSRTLEQMQIAVEQASLGKEGLIYAWRGLPDLIIVDPVLSDLSGEEMMLKLRKDQRTASIPAIALSSDPNPARKNACLQAGFNHYIFKSVDAIPAFLETVKKLLSEDVGNEVEEEKKKKGSLFVFLSAKGGVGTSSLCANLAMNIGVLQKDSRMVVVDGVLPIGSIAQIVGYAGPQNLATVSALNPEKASAAYLRDNLPALPDWHFHLLAGSPDPQSALSLHANRIEPIVNALRAEYDFVVVDLGRALSRISLPLIQQADLIVLVVGNDQSAVALTKIVWQYLNQQGVTADHIYTILNRAVGLEGLTKPEIESLLGLNIKTAMFHMGGNFAVANNQHIPISTKYPRDTATMTLQEAAKQLVAQAQKVRTEMR